MFLSSEHSEQEYDLFCHLYTELYSKVDKNRTKCSATGNGLDLPGCQQKGERSKDVKETHRSNSDPCARKDKIDEIYSRNPTCRNTQAEVQRKPEVPSRPPKRNLKPGDLLSQDKLRVKF